jgi:hypothetical protein
VVMAAGRAPRRELRQQPGASHKEFHGCRGRDTDRVRQALQRGPVWGLCADVGRHICQRELVVQDTRCDLSPPASGGLRIRQSSSQAVAVCRVGTSFGTDIRDRTFLDRLGVARSGTGGGREPRLLPRSSVPIRTWICVGSPRPLVKQLPQAHRSRRRKG